jgi:SAM-dependent MidA family methyltransferase
MIRELLRGSPHTGDVVELGAGRGEMAEAFREFRYAPVELGRGQLPPSLDGVVFSNEFFDALPARLFEGVNDGYREVLVGWNGTRFDWTTGLPATGACARYLDAFAPPPRPGLLVEAGLDALEWLERIAATLRSGYVLTIDYGYSRTEAARFPLGTLMSYQRHTASEDVLESPGERDITAHVNFTALQEHGSRVGLETVRFETLRQALLRTGEPDQFEAALAAGTAEEPRRRLQLKTLLFGLGETFRVLVQRKAAITGVEEKSLRPK